MFTFLLSSFCSLLMLLRLFYYMGSTCLDQSIVCHVCFDLFQHTSKIYGELACVFNLLVGIDNYMKQYYNQIECDESLKTNRSKEDDLVKTDGKLIPIRHKTNLLMGIDNDWKCYFELIDKHNFQTANGKLISYKHRTLIEDDTKLKHIHLKGHLLIEQDEESQWEAGNDNALPNEESYWETGNDSILPNGECHWEPTVDISKYPILFASKLIFLLKQNIQFRGLNFLSLNKIIGSDRFYMVQIM